VNRYRIKIGTHQRNGQLYKVGDEIELSEEKASRLGLDRLELLVGGSIDDSNAVTGSSNLVRNWGIIHAKTVPQVIGIIRSVQTVEDLEAIRDEEMSKDGGRAGVLSAIESRMKELQT